KIRLLEQALTARARELGEAQAQAQGWEEAAVQERTRADASFEEIARLKTTAQVAGNRVQDGRQQMSDLLDRVVRLEAKPAQPPGLAGSAFAAAPVQASGPRIKYPLPDKFDGNPHKLHTFLTAIKGYHLEYEVADPARRVDHAITL